VALTCQLLRKVAQRRWLLKFARLLVSEADVSSSAQQPQSPHRTKCRWIFTSKVAMDVATQTPLASEAEVSSTSVSVNRVRAPILDLEEEEEGEMHSQITRNY
jgi:hypothetical protein